MSHKGNDSYLEQQYEALQEAEAIERKVSIIIICVALFIFFTILIIIT